MKRLSSLRLASVSAILLSLAACSGGDDGTDLTAPRNDLSAADIDAALGPADQNGISDAAGENAAANELFENGNAAEDTGNGSEAKAEERQ